MTPLHKMPKALQDYENKHGFAKTKAMVEFYSTPLHMYNYNNSSKKYCNDCGVEIFKKVRCEKCHEIAYVAAFGKERYDEYYSKK